MTIDHLPFLELEAGLAEIGCDDAITSVGGVLVPVVVGVIAVFTSM